MFILFSKNKGILVLLYLVVCFIVTAVLIGVLHRNTTGALANIDFYTSLGITFILAAAWTYLTSEDYYKDREGNKKKMDTVNEFFFIKMKTWAYIFLILSFLFFGNLLFGYFGHPVANS